MNPCKCTSLDPRFLHLGLCSAFQLLGARAQCFRLCPREAVIRSLAPGVLCNLSSCYTIQAGQRRGNSLQLVTNSFLRCGTCEVFHPERLKWIGQPGSHPVIVPNHITMIEAAQLHSLNPMSYGTHQMIYLILFLAQKPDSHRHLGKQTQGNSSRNIPPRQRSKPGHLVLIVAHIHNGFVL